MVARNRPRRPRARRSTSSSICSRAAVPGPTTARRPPGPCSAPDCCGPQVDRQRVGLAEQRADGGVLPGRDAEGEHHLLGRSAARRAARRQSGTGARRSTSAGRSLVQGALRARPTASRSIRPSAGSGRRRVDAGELERPAVDPGAVAVAVASGTPGGRGRRRRAPRRVGVPPAKCAIDQPAADDPRHVGVRRGVGRDPWPASRSPTPASLRSQRSRSTPAVSGCTCASWKPGDQEAAVERRRPRCAAPTSARTSSSLADRDDATVAHGYRAAGRTAAAEHRPADEDGVGGAHRGQAVAANALSRIVEPLVEQVVGHDERRQEAQHVAVGAAGQHDQPVGVAGLGDRRGQRRRRARACRAGRARPRPSRRGRGRRRSRR